MSLENEIKQEIKSFRHEALLNIVHTHNQLAKFSRLFFKKFRMTEAQYNIMIIIKLEKGKLTQVEISERMVSSRSNITSLIDKLQKKRYVCRVPLERDRRVYHVELMKKGREKILEVEPIYTKTVEEIMECFSLNESRNMSSLLVKVRNNLKEITI